MKIENGEVRQSNGYYIVSCNDGFSLDTIVPEGTRCNCNNGSLTSIIGVQPKCLPDPCVVPYDYDPLISMSSSDFISFSGGSVVSVGEIVYFNCSKASELIYEPLNRRFKCVNGLWIEDEQDKTWKLGNNGTFPKCRKAICEQKCQNEGVCSKDNYCRCKHLTEGKYCERVTCDKECKSNGGKCIGPGKCECPQGKFGTKCEHDHCVVPYDFDSLISILNKDRTSLSGGSVVKVGETVNFDCSNASGLIQEPINRRFKCLNGLWIEDEPDKTWRFGNNGTFPKCRKTKCEQKCQNGGVCSKDNECRCENWTRGKFCENVICDDDCISNGGKCIVPGKCDCPTGKKGDKCQHGNDCCIGPFGSGKKWYPKWNDINIIFFGQEAVKSLEKCQQACINHEKECCGGVYYNKGRQGVQSCNGFSETKERYFKTNYKGLFGSVYLRECKDDV